MTKEPKTLEEWGVVVGVTLGHARARALAEAFTPRGAASVDFMEGLLFTAAQMEASADGRSGCYLGNPPHPPRDALRALTLPCPFCGRTDLLGVERHPESGFLCVRCRACGAVGPAGRGLDGEPLGDHEATAHWNRRNPRVLCGKPATGGSCALAAGHSLPCLAR